MRGEGTERGREVGPDPGVDGGERKRQKQWSRQFRKECTCDIGWPAACCLECGSAAGPPSQKLQV